LPPAWEYRCSVGLQPPEIASASHAYRCTKSTDFESLDNRPTLTPDNALKPLVSTGIDPVNTGIDRLLISSACARGTS